VIAHVGGVPVEEMFPLLVGGMGTGLVLSLTAVVARVRRARSPH
jgi:hypothetical protein